jgi:hypothetical protein
MISRVFVLTFTFLVALVSAGGGGGEVEFDAVAQLLLLPSFSFPSVLPFFFLLHFLSSALHSFLFY